MISCGGDKRRIIKMMKKQGKSRRAAAVKVVYISSPMKVKICASQFRALVQQLTGRDSDVARFMEDKEKQESRKLVLGDQWFEGVDHSHSSSESLLLDVFDVDAFLHREEQGTAGTMFPPRFLCEQVPQMCGMIDYKV